MNPGTRYSGWGMIVPVHTPTHGFMLFITTKGEHSMKGQNEVKVSNKEKKRYTRGREGVSPAITLVFQNKELQFID